MGHLQAKTMVFENVQQCTNVFQTKVIKMRKMFRMPNRAVQAQAWHHYSSALH
jgi:hypothetical protein